MKPQRLLALTLSFLPMASLADDVYEQAPIRYSETEANTPLTRIFDRIEAGESLLDGKTDKDVVVQLLDLLDVPKESQILVYSKTSAQNSLISPRRPRALYFSDNAYIGWVQHGNIETITFDEKLGAVFHMIHLRDRKPHAPPRLVRDSSCLDCHGGSRTRGYPGVIARSVFPSDSGQPLLQAGTTTVDHSTPIVKRWGGWYVTGRIGELQHMGNALARTEGDRSVVLEKIEDGSLEDLAPILDCAPYPGGATSDVTALMVFEHQLAAHNIIVRANLMTQQTVYRARLIQQAMGEPADSPIGESYQGLLDSTAEKVVAALLYKDEFVMEDDGPEGSEAFEKAFMGNSRPGEDGRTLKDFRLYERLFKYRCSYTIYSEPFGHLPDEMKSRVLKRLHAVLTAAEPPQEYAYLSDNERERTASILSETLPGWPTDQSS